MSELEARIRTAIRHHRPEAEEGQAEITVGPLVLDIVHREARVDDRNVELTAKEFDVLAYLARHVGRTCTRQMILVAVWGPAYASETQYLHAYVHRLRQKLNDPDGVLLRTAPGIGYSLAKPEAA
jgi:two-component system, OmpR family, KDP operon response regulator KdpE